MPFRYLGVPICAKRISTAILYFNCGDNDVENKLKFGD